MRPTYTLLLALQTASALAIDNPIRPFYATFVGAVAIKSRLSHVPQASRMWNSREQSRISSPSLSLTNFINRSPLKLRKGCKVCPLPPLICGLNPSHNACGCPKHIRTHARTRPPTHGSRYTGAFAITSSPSCPSVKYGRVHRCVRGAQPPCTECMEQWGSTAPQYKNVWECNVAS